MGAGARPFASNARGESSTVQNSEVVMGQLQTQSMDALSGRLLLIACGLVALCGSVPVFGADRAVLCEEFTSNQ